MGTLLLSRNLQLRRFDLLELCLGLQPRVGCGYGLKNGAKKIAQRNFFATSQRTTLGNIIYLHNVFHSRFVIVLRYASWLHTCCRKKISLFGPNLTSKKGPLYCNAEACFCCVWRNNLFTDISNICCKRCD